LTQISEPDDLAREPASSAASTAVIDGVAARGIIVLIVSDCSSKCDRQGMPAGDDC